MTWNIVADSSCDLFELTDCPPDTTFTTIPFSIRVGQSEYMDDASMPIDAMLTANENHKESAHTACPSPQDWAEEFSRPGDVLAFTISSNLSGSYNSACTAQKMVQEEHPGKQIAVIDTKATGPETVLILRHTCKMIREGKPFNEIVDQLHKTAEKTHIIFALSSYHNLIRNGRVNRFVGLLAGHLGFWGIGIGDDNGEIAIRGKARGQKNMIRLMVEEIKKTGLAGKEIVISHCQNLEAATQLKQKLCEMFEQIKVDILPARGLDSFYAERHGLIVGY